MKETGIITKSVVKDYVSKKCPHLAVQELNERLLVELLKKSINAKDYYEELVREEIEENPKETDLDDFFNIDEILKDYPHIRDEVKKYERNRPKNAAEQLIDDYNDNELISNLSRQYFEEIYGKDCCGRCDLDVSGALLINQVAIVQNTEKLLKDPNIKIIFEGQVEFNGLRARFDVLIKNDDGSFDIVEVKGTNDVFTHPEKDKVTDYSIDTKIKSKYLYDLLFQYYVYSKKFPNINKLEYMFTSRDYELKKLTFPVDKSELDKLFVRKSEINLKEKTMSLIEYFDSDKYIYDTRSKDKVVNQTLEEILDEIRSAQKEALSGKKVCPKMHYLCKKGPACPFIDFCFPETKNNPNTIFKLTNWNLYGGKYTVTRKLIEGLDGYPQTKNISDIFLPSDDYPEKKYPSEKKESRLDEYGLKYIRLNAFNQIKYQKGGYHAKYVMDKYIVEKILKKSYMNDDIDYLVFFDFESFQYPIPLVEHSGCWQQIVNQYSMHICKKGYDLSKHNFAKGEGGGVKHYEYIANPDVTKYKNPCVELFTTLKEQMLDFGINLDEKRYRVVVFNKNFEKTRMNEFVRDFSGISGVDRELLRFVQDFNDNVIDLLDFFTFGGMYSVEFNGRGSLKVVQPTLANDKDVIEYYKKVLPFDLTESLEYHNNLVYNGSICLDLYKSLLVRSHRGPKRKNEPTTQELLNQALAYCKIDSWGTVIIYDVIKNVYLKKLKLDIEYLG